MEEKMRYLMHYCINWGGNDCHPDVSKHRHAKKLKPGEEIPLWPVGKEQERLDEICSKCNYPLKIKEPECPVCGSDNLIHQPLVSVKKLNTVIPLPDIESSSGNTYIYRCGNCRRFLYSTKQL